MTAGISDLVLPHLETDPPCTFFGVVYTIIGTARAPSRSPPRRDLVTRRTHRVTARYAAAPAPQPPPVPEGGSSVSSAAGRARGAARCGVGCAARGAEPQPAEPLSTWVKYSVPRAGRRGRGAAGSPERAPPGFYG